MVKFVNIFGQTIDSFTTSIFDKDEGLGKNFASNKPLDSVSFSPADGIVSSPSVWENIYQNFKVGRVWVAGARETHVTRITQSDS